MAQCYRCGTEIAADKRIFRNSECESCGADLKVCLHCRFYDPGSHWECRETIAEQVKDKDRANFCDYFQLGQRRPGTSSSAGSAAAPGAGADSAAKLRRLFGEE